MEYMYYSIALIIWLAFTAILVNKSYTDYVVWLETYFTLHPSAKPKQKTRVFLTKKQVEIIDTMLSEEVSIEDIMKEYFISYSTVYLISKGKHKHQEESASE
jgi:hypothetical protein